MTARAALTLLAVETLSTVVFVWGIRSILQARKARP